MVFVLLLLTLSGIDNKFGDEDAAVLASVLPLLPSLTNLYIGLFSVINSVSLMCYEAHTLFR